MARQRRHGRHCLRRESAHPEIPNIWLRRGWSPSGQIWGNNKNCEIVFCCFLTKSIIIYYPSIIVYYRSIINLLSSIIGFLSQNTIAQFWKKHLSPLFRFLTKSTIIYYPSIIVYYRLLSFSCKPSLCSVRLDAPRGLTKYLPSAHLTRMISSMTSRLLSSNRASCLSPASRMYLSVSPATTWYVP